MAYVPKFALSVTIVKTLNAIERLIGYLEAAPLTQEWIATMQERALFSEAFCTIHVGHPRLTWNQAMKFLKDNSAPDIDPRDARALTNFIAAYQFVLDFSQNEELISENTICQIHKILESNMNEKGSTPGHYRTIQNYVLHKETKAVVYTPPPVHDISLLMRDFVTWLQEPKTLPPILIAGVAEYHILHISPFLRANGKTARLLAQLILFRSGYLCKQLYAITPNFEKDLSAYYATLKHVREHGKDLTKWLEYFSESILKQLQEVHYEASLVLS